MDGFTVFTDIEGKPRIPLCLVTGQDSTDHDTQSGHNPAPREK